MRITKEILEKQLSEKNKQLIEACQQVTQSTQVDKDKRREFARAFGWFENQYSTNSNPILPTWEQVFTHVGKLLNAESQLRIAEQVDKNCQRLDALESEAMNKQFQS